MKNYPVSDSPPPPVKYRARLPIAIHGGVDSPLLLFHGRFEHGTIIGGSLEIGGHMYIESVISSL